MQKVNLLGLLHKHKQVNERETGQSVHAAAGCIR